MIKLIETIDALGFMPEGAFTAKIQGFALTYGTEYDFARFYVQYIDEEPACALSRVDGNITLYCGANTDYEELREFLGVIGYSSVQCDYDTAEKLKLEIAVSSYIVKYNENKSIKRPKNFNENPDMKKVYSLLVDAGFDMGTYPEFAADICCRINKGTAKAGVIGERDCCVFRLFEGFNCVLLGAVATDEKMRGQGLASSLVTYMAQGDKTPFLLTRNDSLLTFYEKCGFARWGTYAISYQN